MSNKSECFWAFLAIWFLAAAGGVLSAETRSDNARAAPSFELPSITFTPGAEFPLETGKDLLGLLGAVGDLSAVMPLPSLPILSVNGGLSYSFIPVRAETSVSLICAGVGAGFRLELTPQLIAQASLTGGGYFGFFNGNLLDPEGVPYESQSGFGPYLQANLGLSYYLWPFLSVGAGGAWAQYFGLTQGLRVELGTSFHLSGFTRRLTLGGTSFESVFPVLHGSYDTVPLGRTTIRNGERFPLKNIEVSLYVKELMDGPKTCATVEQLRPGESRAVDLYALFADRILGVREDADMAVELSVDYTLNGRRQRRTITDALRLCNRNALTWDDDRKAAGFVSAKDQEVLRVSKLVAGMVRKEGPASIDLTMRIGMGMLEAMSASHISYVRDPNTPTYEAASENASVIDFLQFPNQTLKLKGGDCDDLSILYASLLESVGIETAFITVPGHIYAAFALDMKPQEARRVFLEERELIVQDGKAWVPVEITMVGDSFQNAWQAGAREWNEKAAAGQAHLYPIHEAWKTYETAGTPADVGEVDELDGAAFTLRYKQELTTFIERELRPQIEKIEQAMGNKPESKLLNRIGVLYVRYGLVDQAQSVFAAILESEQYGPTLTNLGNICLLRGDFEKALPLFESALSKDPESSGALLGLARANQGLGRLALARQYLGELESRDPGIAAKYASIGSADQSAKAEDYDALNSSMYWADEE